MLYKPLHIIHVTVKSLLKSYAVAQKQNTSVTKVGMAHAYQTFIYKSTKFQVSVQINEVLLYNKK